jgi:hypothetical protein
MHTLDRMTGTQLNTYARAWAQYKTWSRVGAAGLLVGIVSLGVVVYLDDGVHGKPLAEFPGYLLGGVGVASLLVFLYCYLRQQLFHCPRCGKFFTFGSVVWAGQYFRRQRCGHCDLRLYAGA